MQQPLMDLWNQVPIMIKHIIYAVIVFVIFWLIAKIAVRMLHKIIGTQHQQMLKLTRKVMRNSILLIGLIAALGAGGVNLGALIASAGLLGFTVGYALKDLLSNIVSGAFLLFNNTIQKGDYIAVGGVEGVVEKIELRHTTLIFEGKTHLVPNKKLFTDILTIVPK